MAQFARPSGDLFIETGYTDEGGAATDLYLSVDEVSANDSDYIESPDVPTADAVVLSLGAITDPAVGTGHIVRYRYAKSAAGGDTINLDVELRQGYVNEGTPGTLIASWSHTDISDTLTTASQTLTGPQADAITNYAALSLRIVANP